MEHLTHVDAVSDELGARGLDVIDDEERSLNRARHGRREPLAEHDGARRAGRRHLHHPPVVTGGEIGVQPPPQALVEALGAIDVGHRNDDDLELRREVPGLGIWVAGSLLICVPLIVTSVVFWQLAQDRAVVA